ncbi:MAG: hypothetical protein L0K08_05250 [Bifidobacterium mongoliense]|nr:hypothetical protein [Bifidobacterium mongoliense]
MNTSHSENAAEQHATTFSAGASPDVGRDETPQTTTRHKRGGRRVVRGAGAAGAAVKLHVEDRPSIFEEPRLHQSDVQSDDRSDADATHGSGEAACRWYARRRRIG